MLADYTVLSMVEPMPSHYKIRQFSPAEYQKIMLEVRSVKDFALFLNISREQAQDIIKKHNVLLPPDYVRACTEQYLLERLMIQGSFAKLASELGVSRAFLVTHFRKLKVPAKLYEARPRFTRTEFEKEIRRIGSVRMMARFFGTTESHIRKYADRFGLSLCGLIDTSMTGHSTGKGSRAQDLFKESRASVTRDLNQALGSKADYDFDDLHFGRINVKASRAYKYKAKSRSRTRYWKFSAKGCKAADVFALMFYDEKFGAWLYTMFVSAKSVEALGKQTVTIDEKNLTAMDPNAIHFIDLNPQITILEE